MGKGKPVARAGRDPALAPLKRAAGQIGARAWIVGGFVRDTLLGRPHPDLDVVAEEGKGLELARAFAREVGAPAPVLFERYGTAQVRWGDRLIEFASAREESYAPDSRKPAVRPATLEEDLLRRDFTVNTLLMDWEGEIHDPLGRGLADLGARVLRTPRDPAQTFSDDPLRMLRAIRLAAQLGLSLDPSLIPAMRSLADRLRPPVLSVERVSDELRKMLLSERPELALELMDESRLLDVVLPEVAACRGVAQGGWHTHDVLGHTLLVVEKTPPDLTLRLAALFHDVGKPVTATGGGAFHGHDVEGARLTQEALRRLRFPNQMADRVSRLVRLHLRPVFYEPDWTDSAVRRLAVAAGDLIGPLMALAQADIAASAYPEVGKLDELQQRLDAVLSEKPSRLQLPISGKDIMKARGLRPGPEVGRIKDRLAELLLEGEIEPTREAVLEYIRTHPDL